MSVQADERLRRWRLVLGGGDADGTGISLGGEAGRDRRGARRRLRRRAAETATSRARRGGLGASAPTVARWLGDIRTLLPDAGRARHAAGRDGAARTSTGCCSSPRCSRPVEPDVHLVGTLLALNSRHPGEDASDGAARRAQGRRTTSSAGSPQETRQAITGALDRAARTQPPAPARRRRLEHDDPAQPAPLPARLPHDHRGDARRLRPPPARVAADVILAVDQSGSMAELGRLLERLRRRARLAPHAADAARRLRHRRRRPHREARRSGRRAVRHPARRRHRHQPGARLLPDASSAARTTRSCC